MSSRLLVRLAVFALVSLFALPMAAQDDPARNFPNRRIHVIVGYAAGGGTDVVARVVSRKISERLGQPVIVENKPGAQGIMAAEYVRKSAPDGYTVLMGPIGPMAVNPAIYSKLPYSPLRDFVPISMIASYPLVVVVNSSQPIGSVKELVAFAKARPNNINYAEAGAVYQLANELFNQKTGTQFVRVPYKGSGEMINALMADQVTMAIMDVLTVRGQIKGGKLRVLAVTSAERHPAWPEVPTMAEAGIPDMEITLWQGFFLPAGTPPAIVKILQNEVAQAVKLPEIRERFDTMSINAVGSTSEEFGRFVASEIARWTAVAKAANITAD